MPTPVTYTLLEMRISICAISRRKSVLTPSISWLSSFYSADLLPQLRHLFLKRLARAVEVLGGDCPFAARATSRATALARLSEAPALRRSSTALSVSITWLRGPSNSLDTPTTRGPVGFYPSSIAALLSVTDAKERSSYWSWSCPVFVSPPHFPCYAAYRTRLRSRLKPARPHIIRFKALRRL